jgi:hypothetical protein
MEKTLDGSRHLGPEPIQERDTVPKQYETLLQDAENKFTRQHPGCTTVLNAKTLEVLVISKDPAQIAKKLGTMHQDIVPLFIGSSRGAEIDLHHLCSPAEPA